MRHKFLSLQYPTEYGYAHDSEAWRGNSPVCRHAVMCQTYGDVHANGNYTQHSHEWNVQLEYMSDYLASLAKALLVELPTLKPDDSRESLMTAVQYDIMRRPVVAAIEFCANIVFKNTAATLDCSASYQREAKTRYYSASERKVSASPAKEHDKRYTQVESWNDGSPKAVYRILIPEWADALQKYAYVDAIRTWFLAQEPSRGHYVDSVAEFLEWPEYKDRTKAGDLRHAYDACYALCESWRFRCNAESALSNIRVPEPKPEPVQSLETSEVAE